MLYVLNNAWALLLGMLLLMIGNGLQGTMLGVRGEIEGFTTFQMSFVMSAYFLGFLGGSRATPHLIQRVGHVRVFAALASAVSAVLILYPTLVNPAAWIVGRVIVGFCFSGIYVTAESWLNNAANNETRGQALSAYMIVMMSGVVLAQGLLLVADPSGYVLFVIPSVLVSIAVAPILLSVSPTPAFDSAKPMSLARLYQTSPLGCVGMFVLGGLFAAQFGMAAVYGAEAGFSLPEISAFVSSFYIGALVFQFPLGWLSDRMDRRLLILIVSAVGAVAAVFGMLFGEIFGMVLIAAFFVGGASNPLYSLLLAYTNDFLEFEDMASASGGLIFINGIGAVAGPIVTGWLMGVVGAPGYFGFIVVLMAGLTGYATYRMTQRPAPSVDDTAAYAPLAPSGSPVLVEVAQEYAIDLAQEEEQEDASNQA